jgi:hypothetical protein
VDADCDDGDACTGDVYTPAGCEHVAPVGLEGADGPLSSARSEPLCPAGTIDPKLDEFAMKKLQRALDLVREGAPDEQAESAAATPRQGEQGARQDRVWCDDRRLLQLVSARIDAILATL